MRRRFTTLIAASLAIALFSASALTANASEKTDAAVTESAENFAPEVEQSVSPVRFEMANKYICDQGTDQDGNITSTYSSLAFPRVSLTKECARMYPELDKSMNAFFDQLEKEKKEQYKQLKMDARELHEKDKTSSPDQSQQLPEFKDHTTADVVLADGTAVSIRLTTEYYGGGPHDYVLRQGVTFDTKTGKQLAFRDVVTDTDNAAALVFQKLKAQYPELQPYYSQENVAKAFAAEEDEMFAWTMEPDGVKVFFNSGVLGTEAEGSQEVKIAFYDNTDLFNKEYFVIPPKWILPIDTDTDVKINLGNGETSIRVEDPETENEGGLKNTRVFVINGQKQELKHENLVYYTSTPYLVNVDGKQWIWCFDQSDDDVVTLFVYGLENGKVTYTGFHEDLGLRTADKDWDGEGSGHKVYPLTDPDSMQLSERINALGTYGGYKTYKVSENGTPVTEDVMYTPNSNIEVVTKVNHEFQMVGKDGQAAEMKEYPAGTKCRIRATDKKSVVELEMNGDASQIARVTIDMGQYPHMVDNMEETALFDGIFYAG